MTGGEEHGGKTLLDLIITGLLGAALAALFHAISAMRKHRDEEFNMRRFLIGIFSAGGVGALAAWLLEDFHVSRELSAVIIAMCGYTGGRLLDLIEAEVPETLQALFDGLQKKLLDGRWKHDE